MRLIRQFLPFGPNWNLLFEGQSIQGVSRNGCGAIGMDDLIPAIHPKHAFVDNCASQTRRPSRVWMALVISGLVHLALMTWLGYYAPFATDNARVKQDEPPPINLRLTAAEPTPKPVVEKPLVKPIPTQPLKEDRPPQKMADQKPIKSPHQSPPTGHANPDAPNIIPPAMAHPPANSSDKMLNSRASSETAPSGQGTVFNPTLGDQLNQARAEHRSTDSGSFVGSYTTNTGEEMFIKGNTCSKITNPVDDHDDAVWQIGSRCAWRKSESELFMEKVNKAMNYHHK